MTTYVGETREELTKRSFENIKADVAKDAWIALRQYFCGNGNGIEARIACVVIGAIAREMQARNNSRQLDLVERKLQLDTGSPVKELPEKRE